MRTIDADKVIEKLKEHKRLFCKNRVEFIALSDKDKARVDEIDTCIAELVNAEEVPHAQLGTNLAEVGTDCISREQAIEICNHAIDLLNGQFGAGALVAIKESIEELPPALPEPMKIDLSRFSEENWERIKKEWANTPITAITAEPTPDQNGDLWITVPDIDKVTRIYVQESKSKFCRIFYEEQEQPERIKGLWEFASTGYSGFMRCSVCKTGCCGDYRRMKFCPNCGADMREVTT